ncbi:MAG: DUF1059 domain-containing protein, partial [Gemmatimonadetes bacterium]|nr:DUF1059 domain-containing protein [Gemmatimonadota bacterium]
MMLKMSCRDLGSADCDYVARGKTAEDVKRNLLRHAESDHPDRFAAMTPEQTESAGRRMDEYLASPAARA